MFHKNDLSILDRFLSVERLEWGDIVRFHDDVLGMANAPDAIDSFRRLLQDLAHHPGRVVAFWGTSRCFSRQQCGALLRGWSGLNDPPKKDAAIPCPISGFTMTREENVFCGLVRWLRSVKRPTIMVYQGDVSLSFLGIGLACDYRVAASDTTFYNQGRDLDMPPGAGLLYLLPAYVGLGRANNLVTRIPEMPADSALAWGLLDEVVTETELEQTLRTMAAEISCFSPETLATIKRLLNCRLPGFDECLEIETQGLTKALQRRPWEKLPDGPSPSVPA